MPVRDDVLRKRIKGLSVDDRWSLLKALDPVRAGEFNGNDLVRLERALELRIVSGSPFSYWKKKSQEGQRVSGFDVFHIHLEVSPDVLRERIHTRTTHMMTSGLVDECWGIWIEGVDLNKSPYNSIGYSQVFNVFSGVEAFRNFMGKGVTFWREDSMSLESSERQTVLRQLETVAKDRDLFDKIFYATCQYAKRQRTWFKKLKPDFVLKDAVVSDDLVAAIGEFKNK
jgi:tRNA dimethylallyltransferase